MQSFKNWFEALTQSGTRPPSKFGIDYITKDQPNNQQLLAAWEKKLSTPEYVLSIKDDRFIHFTLINLIPEIMQTNILGREGVSVFAISLTFGVWQPVVQFNHIINKKREKNVLDIGMLKNQRKKKNGIEQGFRIPNFGEEIGAIMFQTNDLPEKAFPEEVIWNKPIQMINSRQISTREAIRLLKNLPTKIHPNSEIKYT